MINNILLVDDEVGFCLGLGKLLENNGYKVDYAFDGKEAKQKLSSTSFDLVITDIVMPHEDGLGLILSVREQIDPPRIIAISGGGRGSATEYLTLAKGFNVDATLQKPFEFGDLLTQIRNL